MTCSDEMSVKSHIIILRYGRRKSIFEGVDDYLSSPSDRYQVRRVESEGSSPILSHCAW